MAGRTGRTKGCRKITFVYEAPGAGDVCVAGSFNEWSLTEHPMKNNGGGVWTKTVFLPPGSYEYKFYVDGLWREDPCNERCCADCFGGLNSVVRVFSKRD